MSTAIWIRCGHPSTPENTVTVRGRFHYCRLCSQQRANQRYRSKTGAKQKAYLTLDDKLDALVRKTPGHWLWQGPMRDGAMAICAYDHDTHFVAQLLWERENGPVPDRYCLYRTCPLSRCVRPQCHTPAVRGSHITAETRGVRGKRRDYIDEGKGRPIYGMSPEAAAIFGLIDDEQYLSRYRGLS